MAIIILAVFFSTLLLAFAGTGRYGLRQSFVYAATIYTLCLVLATELFSIWNILIFEVLLVFWTGTTTISVLYFWFHGNRQVVLQTLNASWARVRVSRALWAVVLVWSVVLAIAVIYPPNNWDSMTYHMARVASWIQQGSINHFPAAYLPQLVHPPLAEWNILHFQILSGGDRFANTVQWLALVGCGLAASLITRELKQPFPVQVLALVITATLPMGLLQGSSTQNDLAVSFWLLAFALFALQYLRKPTVGRMSFCGLALGFALLTKGTTYVVAPPLAAMLLLYGIIHAQGARSRVKMVSAAMVILAIALLLNSGHWARNWSLSGNPLYTGDTKYGNEEVNVSILWSNLIRNSALHWGIPSDRINAITTDVVYGILGDLVDIPEATLAGSYRLRIIFSKHEDHAGNFLHFWVLAFSLPGIVLFRRRFQFNALTVILALAVVLGFVFYCGLLKWSIWTSRLHTPLFMLGAPIVAIFLSSLGSRLQGHFTKIFLIISVPWIFFNETRPIYSENGPSIFSADRTDSYWHPQPKSFRSYVDAVDYLKEYYPKEIGFYGSQYEYPIRVLMKENFREIPKVMYIGVENISRKLRESSYIPRYVLSTAGPIESLHGVSYQVVWISPDVIVLAREDIASELVNRMFEGDTLVIESNYDVYIRGNMLLYVKEPCSQDDEETHFFLHVYSSDTNDLPGHLQEQGFASLDFAFEEYGWRSGDRCLAARWLPWYATGHVETGQYGPDGGRLWAGSIPFDGEQETG